MEWRFSMRSLALGLLSFLDTMAKIKRYVRSVNLVSTATKSGLLAAACTSSSDVVMCFVLPWNAATRQAL